jgi:hypothetical protein
MTGRLLCRLKNFLCVKTHPREEKPDIEIIDDKYLSFSPIGEVYRIEDFISLQ